jgi:UDP-N-acetylglucosamine 2-epimerase (non-hydrolysing)
MKIAPVVRAIRATDRIDCRIVHTGQHYDRDMNAVFFEELGIPAPDVFMGAGGGTHAQQTARILVEFESLCLAERPDVVVVVGDVNSTAACSLAAKKLQLPVAHIEAGLRSGDMRMPEEINRLVTDAICDWLFATEPSAVSNLLREGHPEERIFEVGNVMVDNLLYQCARLHERDRASFALAGFKNAHDRYAVLTLHRPSNVDDAGTLRRLAAALSEVARTLPIVFPAHPRTRSKLLEFGIELGPDIVVTGPLGYMDFLNLWRDARVVLTDSGGLQEETTALGVPCVTLRENTERPITVEEGTNVIAGTDPPSIHRAVALALVRGTGAPRRPSLWDGHAAERIADILARKVAAE